MFVSVGKKVTFRCTVPLISVVAQLQCYENRFTFDCEIQNIRLYLEVHAIGQ
jgi:hypothetical protein